MIKNWGVIGGIAAAIVAGVYVLWGPITERKKRKRGKNQYNSVLHRLYVGYWPKSNNLTVTYIFLQVWFLVC